MVYWAHQVARTRCRQRKAKMQAAWQEERATLDQYACTQRLAPQLLADWKAWATKRFFRREFPNLFESLLLQIDALPLPRQRHQVLTVSS